MSQDCDVRIALGPPPLADPGQPLRWLCTRNPFYALSAALFLAGLWISFGSQLEEDDTWALMVGLAGYTLLLAVTACLLVRFGHVWDDARTVLLLIVLMFLATSVTFDDPLVRRPRIGTVCYVIGFVVAVLVSEGVLRGIRLRLPLLFRVPYHLILALFFLYPLAIRPLVDKDQPHSEGTMWGLYAFSAVAGLIFLTLLPAIRQGRGYVRDNGSPWPWPLYPWALFSLLILAVPARAFLLCWSMHLVAHGDLHEHRRIFGAHFLLPFGWAVAVLVLESGLVSARRRVVSAAILLPAALVAATWLGHRSEDGMYLEFLRHFTYRLGGDPLCFALAGAAGFYAYALIRGVIVAAPALALTLALLSCVGPDALEHGPLYVTLRQSIKGIDYLAASLLLFVVAALVSALKSGHLGPWLQSRLGVHVPPSHEPGPRVD